jgi:hypothetical protein
VSVRVCARVRYLYGARASRQQLGRLLRWTFWLQIPCAIVLTLADSDVGATAAAAVGGGSTAEAAGSGDAPALPQLRWRMLGWFAVCIGVNGLYNHPVPRFSERPPLDLLSPAGCGGRCVLFGGRFDWDLPV